MQHPPSSLKSKVHSLGVSPPFSTASMVGFRKIFSSRTMQGYLPGRVGPATPTSSTARQRERHPLTGRASMSIRHIRCAMLGWVMENA